MTDKQPTQEQIKEFWEWCGFSFMSHSEMWVEPIRRTIIGLLPPIDLNNLFKYAVPKLECCLITTDSDKGFRAEASIKGTWYEYSQDPALALFWAIYSIFHIEESAYHESTIPRIPRGR